MKRALAYAGILAAALSSAVGIARKTTLFDSYGTIAVQVRDGKSTKELRVPLYNPIKVPPGHCTKYGRMVAYELFGKDFPPGDAWDRKYTDTVVAQLDKNDSLEELARKGILQQGMLVGVYNPHTSRTAQEDKFGKPADITHVVEYLGMTPEGRAVVAEQYGFTRHIRTEAEMREQGLTPLYIFDAPSSTAPVHPLIH